MEIINSEIVKIKQRVLAELNETIADEKAFVLLCLNIYFMPKASCRQLLDNLTDGANDGGADFIYFDEEELKINICQCKFTQNLNNEDIVNEFSKIEATVNDFRRHTTSKYNVKVRELLQNAIDRFDPNNEAIEYNLFTLSEVNKETLMIKIDSLDRSYSSNNVTIYSLEDISNYIIQQETAIERVTDTFKLQLDGAGNKLGYQTKDSEGAFINVSSESIKQMYNKYLNKGLLDQNIRKFVANRNVDSGIKHTLANEREKFWFYNNGITIACETFQFDGNTVKLSNFSIVNGGQTTTLIGKDVNNGPPFFVPCKLISYQGKGNFIEKISEATNSQKPIQPRDLKSNSKEMKIMAGWLYDNKIVLDIKRGEKNTLRNGYRKIKNDELGQLILSFVYQQPGTSRSGKKALFDNPEIYSKIFRKGYEKSAQKKAFIVDLIDLNERYTRISTSLKEESNELNNESITVLKNAKQIMFALFGMLYQIVNEDITRPELVNNPSSIIGIEFVYDKFISNYKGDDIDERIEKIISSLTLLVTEAYQVQEVKGEVTSVSNFFKTDKKYQEAIIGYINPRLSTVLGTEIIENSKIFNRA